MDPMTIMMLANAAASALKSSGGNNSGGSSGGGWEKLLGLAPSIGLGFWRTHQQAAARNRQAQAIQDTLDKIEKERQAAKKEIGGYYTAGNEAFQTQANTEMPELANLQDLTTAGISQPQLLNYGEYAAQLAKQGVRGPQADILQSRQQGNLTQDLSQNLGNLALGEAQNRQKNRLSYNTQQALKPYETLTGAPWLYMPTLDQLGLMQSAINAKYGGVT